VGNLPHSCPHRAVCRRARLAHEATAVDVAARAATEAERVQILARSATIYGGYAKYLSRISGRQVRIFVLERAGA
jgi:hypothetical protein